LAPSALKHVQLLLGQSRGGTANVWPVDQPGEAHRLAAEARARVLIDRQLTEASWSVHTDRWKSFGYDELIARDKVNLDITWLRDDSLEDADNLPAPAIIAREIVADLTAALAEFEAVAAALERRVTAGGAD
jgi:hypothetical protein